MYSKERKYAESKMASTVNTEDGRKLTGCMVYCLRADAGRLMFGWFELTGAEKKT